MAPFQKPSSLIIGRQPILEALKEGKQLERIFLQKNTVGDIIGEIKKYAAELQVPINIVPPEKLNSLSRSNHQGVIGIRSLVQYFELQQVIDFCTDKGETPLFLMLDGVTDVRNIGGIARSALVCGAQAIIIPDRGVGALNEEAVKASAGALEQIHICRVTSLLKAVDSLHLNGFKIFSSELDAPVKVYEADFTAPSCIIVGNEEKGIQPYLTKASDVRFTIPMRGKFDSLNVSVATGIILFEALKQRMK